MKPIKVGKRGRLQLTVESITGYEISGVSSPRRAEYDRGIFFYELSGVKVIPHGQYVFVEAINARLSPTSQIKFNIEDNGIVLNIATIASYYVAPTNLGLILGLK